MSAAYSSSPQGWVASLRGFLTRTSVVERCELCGTAIPTDHAHLVEPANCRLFCACTACAIACGDQASGRYRRIPERIRFLADFRMTDRRWEALRIPVDMAFFLHSTTAGGIVAVYPSPAGATESLLELASWDALVAANPSLAELEPDVEALLVNRRGGAREYYLVPIDRCYELVGLIRAHWQGLSGGPEFEAVIRDFFTRLKASALPVVEVRSDA